MILAEEDHLAHYGTLRKSGRYPWGSGSTQTARHQSFLDIVAQHEKDGMTAAQIGELYGSDEFPLNSTSIRALKSIAKNELKQDQIRKAEKLKAKGLSNVAIGNEMGVNESSVRALLAPGAREKAEGLDATVDLLRREVADKGYIDIGVGVHHQVGVSEDKLKIAVAKLREEGYKKHYVTVQQLGTGENTSIRVLGGPGSKYPKQAEIRGIQEHFTDTGKNPLGIDTPMSISSKRVAVRHAEDGGTDADGVIYVRPGVKDVSFGSNAYAQVRIAVDGTHYLKGMAVYKDDLPAGVDLMFNTNKSNTGNKLDALKPLKKDKATGELSDNPFGSIVRQIHGPDGKLSSAMNIVGQKEGSGVEGGWGEWSKSLSSQVLSKQPDALAKQQLDMMFERKRNELDAIKELTNPAVRRRLLKSYGDDTDSSAVHLKAAALPGQATHVILPVNSMKPGEVFAPNYDNGVRVALVRYPHAGTFEIPELVVNNKNREALSLLGKQPRDAIGIHHSVAERLSGADFDGDTVLVIPNNNGAVKSTSALKGLENFDSKQYKIHDMLVDDDGKIVDPRAMTSANTQMEMGKITNLISDMTIRGANMQEMAQAVRHSMVVIDAEKHGLHYKASEVDHGINALKERYQSNEITNGKGASTLVTRAKSTVRVEKRRLARAKEGGPIDPVTGEKRWVKTGEERTLPDKINKRTGEVIPGKTIKVTEESTRLREAKDAHDLVSDHGGTSIERIYADHSNRLKALANESRVELVKTPSLQQNASAKRVYRPEVESLNRKLNTALENAPRERQAQLLGNQIVRLKKQDEPGMDKGELRKVKAQALAEARIRTGASKERVEITPKEWEAIQAGAISNHKLDKILDNAEIDKIKEYATPRAPRVMSATKLARAKQMLASGYTQAEVARNLGVSTTTLQTFV